MKITNHVVNDVARGVAQQEYNNDKCYNVVKKLNVKINMKKLIMWLMT